MQAYCLTTPGSIAGLVLTEVPEPDMGLGDVLIRVHAVSINNRDLMVVHDQYGFPIPPGLIPLSDAAGEVVAIGAKVRGFVPGDRVSPAMQIGWIGGPPRPEFFGTDLGGSLPGVFAQYIAIPEAALVRLPSHLSFEQAATLNCAGGHCMDVAAHAVRADRERYGAGAGQWRCGVVRAATGESGGRAGDRADFERGQGEPAERPRRRRRDRLSRRT